MSRIRASRWDGRSTTNARFLIRVDWGKMLLHIASQYGVDSRLISLLLSKPFKKIGIQPDRDGFLRRRHDDSRTFPKLRIGRSCVGVFFDCSPDLAVSPN